MALEVIMPSRRGYDRRTNRQWNKKVGEFVKKEKSFLEIMADKVSMELEAEEDG